MTYISRTLVWVVIYVLCLVAPSTASVILKGNRIIYSAAAKEKVVEFMNDGDTPMLVQVWMDVNNPYSTPETADAPFIATPQIFRMNINAGQALRLKYTGQPLPDDRESLFWLNYLQFPAIKSADAERNRLSLVVKSRLKIFYRPAGLKDEANQAPAALRLIRQGRSLSLTNPTPWHINVRNAVLKQGDKTIDIGEPITLPPFGSTRWSLPETQATSMTLYAINDYGTAVAHAFTLPR
ncbi:molecular chaperone [Enterobacter chuandaensis]|nr:molecular chaperone [Enterobacter chuandaensis]